MSQKYNSEYVKENEAFFIGRNDIINRYGNVISHYRMLPGLIGFWPMATVQRSTGNVPNYAPTYTGATKQDLVYNGNPTFNYTATGVPYIDLDGTGDYLSVADNTDLDVQGNEAQYANPGLTLGCWFWADGGAGTNRGIFSKHAGAPNISFSIFLTTTNFFQFLYSVDGNAGASLETQSSSTSPATGEWHFGVGRWTPSTERSVFLDGIKNQTSSSAFATIANTGAALEIGRIASSNLIDGRVTLAFLCASALSDAIIQSLFQQTRSLFGV